MPLTDTAVRAAKPANKPQKLFDDNGLFLFVTPGGTKSWRVKYRFQGREKLLTLGTYPLLSLKEARDGNIRGLVKKRSIKAKQKAVQHPQQAAYYCRVQRVWGGEKSAGKCQSEWKNPNPSTQ